MFLEHQTGHVSEARTFQHRSWQSRAVLTTSGSDLPYPRSGDPAPVPRFPGGPGPHGSFLVGHKVYTVLLANALTINKQPDLSGSARRAPGTVSSWGATEVTDTSRLRVVHPLQLGGASQFDGRPSQYTEGVAVG